jgi:hypothetical protein
VGRPDIALCRANPRGPTRLFRFGLLLRGLLRFAPFVLRGQARGAFARVSGSAERGRGALLLPFWSFLRGVAAGPPAPALARCEATLQAPAHFPF